MRKTIDNIIDKKGFTFYQIMTILFLMSVIFIKNDVLVVIFQIVAVIFCVLSYYKLYLICLKIIHKAKIEAENEILKKQIEVQKEHYIALQESQKQLDEIKRDILATIDLEDEHILDDETSLRAYMNDLISHSEALSNIDYCHHKVVDAILYNKMLIAHSLDIATEVEVILPESIDVDVLDLMKIYGNLLDNAIEACVACKASQRHIYIRSYMRQGCLFIQVENSKNKEQLVDFDHPITSKKDKEAHGLGIKIIKQSVAQYHGTIEVINELDQVRIMIVLNTEI